MWSFIKKRWYIVLGILLLIGFVGYRIVVGSQPKGKPYTVKKEDLVETLSFSGQVDASEKAILRFQSSGRLALVKVKEGDQVKRGQLVASLDLRDLKAAETAAYYRYLAADANAKEVEDEVKGHDSDESFSQKNDRVGAQTTRDIRYDDWQSAIRAVSFGSLFSPFNGLITRVDVPESGINITPASSEFEVVNPGSIFFSALADQTEVIRLKEGMKAKVTLDAYPEEEIEATVSTVGFSPKEGETGTVYEIKLNLGIDNADYRFRLGMTGDVEFLLSEKKDVIAVPAKYVKSEGGEKQVLKMSGGKISGQRVKIGTNFDGTIEILEGLNEGEVIYDQAD